MAREDLTVLEGSRLALVAIADDILLLPGRAPDVVPLLLRWHPRAPHPAQISHLQLLDHPFACAAGHEGPHRLVVPGPVVGIDPPRLVCDRHPVGVGGEVPPGEDLADGPVDLRLIAGHEERVVDGHGHRPIAPSQARRMADGDPAGRDLGRPAAFEGRLQSGAPLLVAGHVMADAHLHARRGFELEMGKEARHFLEPMERRAGSLRQAPQFLPGQVAVVMLDPVEFLDDHRRQTRGRGGGRRSIRRGLEIRKLGGGESVCKVSSPLRPGLAWGPAREMVSERGSGLRREGDGRGRCRACRLERFLRSNRMCRVVDSDSKGSVRLRQRRFPLPHRQRTIS